MKTLARRAIVIPALRFVATRCGHTGGGTKPESSPPKITHIESRLLTK